VTTSTYVTLGPYTAGEIPENWVHAWDDIDGADIDLEGFAVDVYYKVNGGTQVQLDTEASLFDADTGRTIVTWSASDFATAGLMAGELVVDNGTLKLAQAFQCVILPARGGSFGA
jgi:hypothetical protein